MKRPTLATSVADLAKWFIEHPSRTDRDGAIQHLIDTVVAAQVRAIARTKAADARNANRIEQLRTAIAQYKAERSA